MSPRVIAAIVAPALLFALGGCASSTPAPAAPSPVVTFAVPAPPARTPSETSRFELPAYQLRVITADTRPVALSAGTRPVAIGTSPHIFAGRH